MTVKPGNGFADATENNPVSDELIHIINVEAMISSCPQTGKGITEKDGGIQSGFDLVNLPKDRYNKW